MTSPKIKKTVSIDADLVDFVGEGNLSHEVNEALRVRLERQRRRVALGEWLDELAVELGPPDQEELAYFRRLLGGPDDEHVA